LAERAPDCEAPCLELAVTAGSRRAGFGGGDEQTSSLPWATLHSRTLCALSLSHVASLSLCIPDRDVGGATALLLLRPPLTPAASRAALCCGCRAVDPGRRGARGAGACPGPRCCCLGGGRGGRVVRWGVRLRLCLLLPPSLRKWSRHRRANARAVSWQSSDAAAWAAGAAAGRRGARGARTPRRRYGQPPRALRPHPARWPLGTGLGAPRAAGPARGAPRPAGGRPLRRRTRRSSHSSSALPPSSAGCCRAPAAKGGAGGARPRGRGLGGRLRGRAAARCFISTTSSMSGTARPRTAPVPASARACKASATQSDEGGGAWRAHLS